MSDLYEYALNALRADDTGRGPTLTDSFGVRTFTAERTGLRDERGQLLTSRQALLRALRPAAHLNAPGLTSGTICTALGPVPFEIHFDRAARHPQATAHRVSLTLNRPWMFANTWFDDLHLTQYDAPGCHFTPCESVTQTGERHHEPSPALRTFLRTLGQDVCGALLTPAAQIQAQRTELAARLSAAREAARQAQAIAERLEAELLSWPPAPGGEAAGV